MPVAASGADREFTNPVASKDGLGAQRPNPPCDSLFQGPGKQARIGTALTRVYRRERGKRPVVVHDDPQCDFCGPPAT